MKMKAEIGVTLLPDNQGQTLLENATRSYRDSDAWNRMSLTAAEGTSPAHALSLGL